MNQLSLFSEEDFQEKPQETAPVVDMEARYQALMSELDSYQAAVVNAPTGESMACIAGAGSGKTRTIITRAIKMVWRDNLDPKRIVLITFTNKAARELKERYLHFFAPQYPDPAKMPTPHISTIHSFCLHQLRRVFGFKRTILSEYQSKKLFREVATRVLTKGGESPDVATMNRLYVCQQALQASMDSLLFFIPKFNRDGTLDRIYTNTDYAQGGIPPIVEKMPYLMLSRRLRGDGVLAFNQDFASYAGSALSGIPVNFYDFIKVMRQFVVEKYMNQCLDFSDMDYQYLMFMAQFPELRGKVHNNISHIFQDEAQDSSCAQFLACVVSDRDSFETFQGV